MSTQPTSDPYESLAKDNDPYASIARDAPAAAPADTRNSVQKSFDENTSINPSDTLLQKGLKSVVGSIGSPFVHPLNTAKNLIPQDYATELKEAQQQPKQSLASGVVTGLGQAFGGLALGAAGGEAMGAAAPVVGKIGGAVRSAAIGDADAAAMRGLKVPAGSPKMQRSISSVQTARPYLQGAESQADLQARIPAAKSEIWGPYQQAIDAGKNLQVRGPDGPTTLGELEQERLQLSALNRGLKMREPEAIQLAQQKGMNQAQLLDREKAVQGALDPELTKMGIKPQEIRKTFGAVAQIGQKVSGKSTIIEPQQPYGFSKIKDLSLTKPLSNIPTVMSAGRDIAAGRYMSASPIDTGIREGFRGNSPKPDLGRLTSTLQPPPPRNLIGPGAIRMPAPMEVGGTPAGYQPPPVYVGTNASRLGRMLEAPKEPPIRLTSPPEKGGTPEGYQPPPFYRDTDAMRTGRLLNAPPIELGGAVEGARVPPFRHDTTPMRQGRILPPPEPSIPMSSHSDIFPDQLPGARRKPKIIEGQR